MAYSSYTDLEVFLRDVVPASSDALFPRLCARSADIAFHAINSKLAPFYSVPFTAPYPGIIVAISDLMTKCVVSRLQARRGPVLPKPGKVQRDAMHDDCSIAMAMLEDLVSGGVIPGITPLAGTQGYHTRDGYTPVFDVDTSENHHPDQDLIDAIFRERS